MKPIVKGLIAGLIIILIGVIILIAALGMNGWKFAGLGIQFETRTFTAEQDNTAVSLDVDAGVTDVVFYEGDKIKVDYPYADEYQTNFVEENGKLTISAQKNFKNFMFFNKIPATKIYLPQDIVFSVTLDVDAGTASLASGTYGDVLIKLDAGTVKLGDVVCKNFESHVNAGTFNASSIVCDKMEGTVDAGTFKISNLVSPQIKVDVDAGTATLNVSGERAEYDVITRVSVGTCKINGQKVGSFSDSAAKEKRLQVDVDAGTININFSA